MAHSPVVPQRVYWLVFVTLLLLTLVTVDVAFYDLGWLNISVALALATTKALLVVLYFMHLKYSSRMIWGFVGAALFWFLLLVGLTATDIFTRDWVPEPPGWTSHESP
jgi:cytochrome c oxidase subunit 4